jgi:hypothetical protein
MRELLESVQVSSHAARMLAYTHRSLRTCKPVSLSQSRSRSRTVYFSNISQRKMNNSSRYQGIFKKFHGCSNSKDPQQSTHGHGHGHGQEVFIYFRDLPVTDRGTGL